MDFTRFRVWQWMLIGLLAGTLVGFAWSNQSNDLPRTVDETVFRRGVLGHARLEKQGRPPLLRNVVVFEPETNPSGVLVYPVRFEYVDTQALSFRDRLRQATQPAAAPKYTASGVYAKTPFDAGGKESVIDFLKKNNMPFTDRSGPMKYMPLYIGAGAGLVGIGMIWPAVIAGLVRFGIAKPPPPREKKAKAAPRTGEDVDEMLVKAKDRNVKAADVAKLDALNDQMEKTLAANLSAGGPRPAAPTTPAEHVSVLMSGAAARNASDPTAEPAPPMTEQEKKDYAGEWYPVVRPHGHKDDERPH